MKKFFIGILAAVFTSSLAFGQGELDAVKYSQTGLSGSARGLGMGGAFGALGGDITGVKSNPGGLAIYRSSEVVGTLDFNSNTNKATLDTYSNSQNKFKLNLGNLSYIGYFPLQSETFKSFNVGLTYNKIMDFDRTFNSATSGMNNSLLDYISYKTNGIDVSNLSTNQGTTDPYASGANWSSVMAYQAFLMNNQTNSTTTYERNKSFMPDGTLLSPGMNMHEKGYIDSYDFSLGTNVSDVLYMGLTMSFTDLQYTLNSLYSENFTSGGSNRYLDLTNYLHTSGAGYQVSVGLIYRPVDALRLGVAYHSPTWYNMTDSYYADLGSSMSISNQPNPILSPYSHTDYNFRTPSRWVFSAAGIISDKAVIDVDYEISNFKGMNLSNSGNSYYGADYSQQNSYINQDLRLAQTVRAGLEYRILPQFSMRIGYGFVESPYGQAARLGNNEMVPVGTAVAYTTEGYTHYYTYGLGYKFDKHFYADAAFVFSQQDAKAYYFPTVFNQNGSVYIGSPETKLNYTSVRGLLTLGYRF